MRLTGHRGNAVRRPTRYGPPRRGGLLSVYYREAGMSGRPITRTLRPRHSEQIEAGGRIITRRLGQRVDTDHA